jgi:hypothetical protein
VTRSVPGAVDAVNLKLSRELIGERANRKSNRDRATKLVDLLTVGLNGRANEREFTKAIRVYLEGHHGRSQLLQRGMTTSRAHRPPTYT